MISQPTVQSTGPSTASGSIPVQPGEKWGVWAGVKVAFWDGFIPFWQSWDPDYVPPGMQPDKGPTFTFGSPDGQDSSFFEGVALGARLVSPYTVLPAEISTMLEGFITLSSAARLRDLFGATKGSPPGQSQADSPVDGSPTNDKGRKKKKPQQTPQRTSPPATASVGPGQLPKAAVALGALSGLSAAAASPSDNKTEGWIEVPNATTLGKIGHHPDYPLNGTYRQTADIDGSQLNQSIGSKTDPFTGEYDGQCRTISNLSDCFVDTLNGSISHLRFTGANINSTEVTGLAACVVGINGTVSGIRAENVHISTSGEDAHAGIGGGRVDNGGTVANTMAVDSTVETSGRSAGAGIGGGMVDLGGTVANTTAVNSTVKTSGDNAPAGIGVGGGIGTVTNTTAVNSRVKTSGRNALASIRGGDNKETVANTTTAVNSYVNGIKKNFGSIFNDQLLCQKADLRVLTANCSSRTEFLDALDFSYSNACPVNAATMTLPTTAAPLAATLSTGAVAGIALGAAAFVVAGVVAGRYIYRHYYRGSYPAAAGDPQELVAINTVGQAQKARTQPMIKAVRKEAREKPAVVQRPIRPPPEPPRLQQPALPENPPIGPRVLFFEGLSEQVIPWHEHKYDDVCEDEKYDDVGEYEDTGIYEDVGVYEDAGIYEEVDTGKRAK
ncbi:hypothetical protein [Endozoicomonas acroporae]|uniref:hypothetical protein n=1 Tax=Endozoicomonas acroporae TaxID=1701104 RepID=UPI003D79BD74